MQLRLITFLFALFAGAALAHAALPVDVELATEQGVQITAPQEWLQLLAGLGIDRVRVRGIRPGDAPRADNRGMPERPNYRVVGILTRGDQLRLPGGTFTQAERGKLKDYFDRLTADGAESLTAPRGRFGLTEKEMTAVLADLAQPIEFETKGRRPQAIVERLQTKFAHAVALNPDAAQTIRDAKPFTDELKGVAAGTGLAMLLQRDGLLMRPEKLRGKPVVYHVAMGGPDAIRQSTLGKRDATDVANWPVGWEPAETPGRTCPSLFESLNAEIDGYTLEEALAAIAPRLKAPLFFDHAALAALKVEPSKVQVTLARSKMSYKRLLDRIVAQARLGCELRVDEAGRPFLWITR